MANRPNPDGWQGGGEDFEFVRTLDGHIGVNVFTDPDLAADIDYRRNSRSFERANLGGLYDPHGESESSEGESLLEP